jgi:hypothetical protein
MSSETKEIDVADDPSTSGKADYFLRVHRGKASAIAVASGSSDINPEEDDIEAGWPAPYADESFALGRMDGLETADMIAADKDAQWEVFALPVGADEMTVVGDHYVYDPQLKLGHFRHIAREPIVTSWQADGHEVRTGWRSSRRESAAAWLDRFGLPLPREDYIVCDAVSPNEAANIRSLAVISAQEHYLDTEPQVLACFTGRVGIRTDERASGFSQFPWQVEEQLKANRTWEVVPLDGMEEDIVVVGEASWVIGSLRFPEDFEYWMDAESEELVRAARDLNECLVDGSLQRTVNRTLPTMNVLALNAISVASQWQGLGLSAEIADLIVAPWADMVDVFAIHILDDPEAEEYWTAYGFKQLPGRSTFVMPPSWQNSHFKSKRHRFIASDGRRW